MMQSDVAVLREFNGSTVHLSSTPWKHVPTRTPAHMPTCLHLPYDSQAATAGVRALLLDLSLEYPPLHKVLSGRPEEQVLSVLATMQAWTQGRGAEVAGAAGAVASAAVSAVVAAEPVAVVEVGRVVPGAPEEAAAAAIEAAAASAVTKAAEASAAEARAVAEVVKV